MSQKFRDIVDEDVGEGSQPDYFNKKDDGTTATTQDKMKGLAADDPAPVELPKEYLNKPKYIPSMSDEDSRKMNRTETAFVPKVTELAPPETETARPINEKVFSGPADKPYVRTERASPTEKVEVFTGKNLALVVGIMGLALYLAL